MKRIRKGFVKLAKKILKRTHAIDHISPGKKRTLLFIEGSLLVTAECEEPALLVHTLRRPPVFSEEAPACHHAPNRRTSRTKGPRPHVDLFFFTGRVSLRIQLSRARRAGWSEGDLSAALQLADVPGGHDAREPTEAET